MAVKRRARSGALPLVFLTMLVLCSCSLWSTAPVFVPPPRKAAEPPAFDGKRLLQTALSTSMSMLLGEASPASAYELPPLRYDYDALEPVIDKETMMFHHDKHHATYIGGLNAATEGQDQPPLLDIIRSAITSGKRPHRNAGGGVWNHNFFWLCMAPPGTGGAPSPRLQAAIDEAFGSMEGLKETFAAGAAPAALFGSGWAWLIVKDDGKLEFTTTPNQDNPLMEGLSSSQGIPILTHDVWEHAYYLKYQNRRPEWTAAWWDVVNWNQVNEWYEDALKGKAPIVDG